MPLLLIIMLLIYLGVLTYRVIKWVYIISGILIFYIAFNILLIKMLFYYFPNQYPGIAYLLDLPISF